MLTDYNAGKINNLPFDSRIKANEELITRVAETFRFSLSVKIKSN